MGDHQSNTMTAEQNNFAMRGVLAGHAGWVTSIVTSQENPDTILSSSRDKTVIVWQLTREDTEYGFPKRALTGHSHFVQDVKISSDGLFALSGSWDGTLRLWDICTGRTTRRFVGHSKDVLSVALSVDNRQIVSASRDKSIKLWNTLGECKYTIGEQGGAEGHTEWVSCVNFVPNQQNPSIVSGGWDKIVKVWNMSNCKLRTNLAGHSGYINAVAVSPDGSLCASGGKDGVAMLCASPPTGTGCAPPPTTASASGISRARASSMSSSSTSLWSMPSPRLSQCPASPSPGPPTATPSSRGTPTARSACGR